MGDTDSLIRARIRYNGREKYFHGMQVAAVEGIKRFAGQGPYSKYSYKLTCKILFPQYHLAQGILHTNSFTRWLWSSKADFKKASES